jgi:hypothetical protein
MSDRDKLRFGPYLTPVFAVGAVVECEVRGLVQIVGLSSAALPWPVGEQNDHRELVVYKGLARAVRQEAAEAVASAFGVSRETALLWQARCNQPRPRKKQTRTSLPLAWKRGEDELLTRLSMAEVARLTGRTLTAVRKRRRFLGLPDGRLAATKALREPALAEQVARVRQQFQTHFSVLRESLERLEATCAYSRTVAAYWRAQRAFRTAR